jgi:hypothetical protein
MSAEAESVQNPAAGPGAVPPDPAERFVAVVAERARASDPTLVELVGQCRTLGLFEKFVEADHNAKDLQDSHRVDVSFAVYPSGAALLLGIFQLAFHEQEWTHSPHLLGFELLLIVTGAAAVALGSLKDWHKHWLLERYRAERLRLLVFELAIDPRLWTGEEPKRKDWLHWIRPKMTPIETLTVETLAQEAGKEHSPAIPPPSACGGLSRDALESLIAFYSATWLDSQIEYFTKKVSDAEKRFWDRPGLATLAFASSVVVVLVHIAFAYSHNRGWSLACLIVAACIPAFAAAWKTFRSALELSRNAKRAGARLASLNGYSKVLHDEVPELRPKAEDEVWFKFKTLALCQSLLENEQREWLRLMYEADWSP